jgi:hypothetical protein
MCSKREQLLSDLRRIQKNQYQLDEGEKAFDHIPLMLEYIGDPDPELRDELIYSVLCEWICEKEYFSDDELLYILSVIIDEDYLFCHIGSDGDDTVFIRTFSVLVAVLILYRHRKKPFLDYNMFIKLKNDLIRYYTEEKDLRGYTEDKGWAHGAAHGADALDEIILCKECDENLCTEILEAIKKVLHNGKYIFCNEEDERIARAVYRMIKGDLFPYQSIVDWIEGLCRCCNWEYSRSQYVARVNTKNFIRCLYFKFMHSKSNLDITNVLFCAEEKVNRFFQIDKNI